MNIHKVTAGIATLFFAFVVPVLNHGFWVVASTIQNAGRMIGDNNVVLEHIWPKADLLNFIYQMPWIMWLYFLPMIGLGLYLVLSGLKDKRTER